MKAIIAVSNDGYLAKGPSDNMKWTGSLDKGFFKLYTLQNRTLFCGTKTFEMMPKTLEDRTLIDISKDEFKEFQSFAILGWLPLGGRNRSKYRREYRDIEPSRCTIIGGPTFLKACFDASLVDEICVCTIKNVDLTDGIENDLDTIYKSESWTKISVFDSESLNVSLYRLNKKEI